MTVTRRIGAFAVALALLASMLVFAGQAFADEQTETIYPDEACAATERALAGSSLSLKSLDEISTLKSSNGTIIIAVDAGHGTDPETGVYDPGAIGYGFDEAVANQNIANACYSKINSCSGIQAIMVPQYQSVTRRVDWAISQGADLYLSLHNNSAGESANGCEVWIQNDSSYNYQCHEMGADLADRIQSKLGNLGLYVRGTQTRDCTTGETYPDGHLEDYYSANYEPRIYGVCGFIVEHAFVTNPDDNAKLQDTSFCIALGEADAQSILDYYGISPINPQSCNDYVVQLYRSALGREPDEAGKAAQVNYLLSGGSAVQVAYNVFTSPEFNGLNLSNSERVNRVYLAMLNRGAESEGLNHWTAYLDTYMSTGAVVVGVGGCSEFTNRMASLGVPASAPTNVEARDRNYYVTAFATRLYSLVLNRTPDIDGLNAQTGALLSGAGAAEISKNFFISNEYAAMGLSNEASVTRVYQVMLNRSPEAAGLQYWMNYLDVHMSIVSIVAGFANADEFRANCASWGVNPGTVTITESRDVNYNVTAFTTRLYSLVLNRTPDIDGLNVQTNALLNGLPAGIIAQNFFLSPEFTGRSLTNEQRVTIAYRTLLNREPDAAGLEDWTSRLNNGMPLSYLVAGFVDSEEFNNLCAQYGIQPGHIDYDPTVMESYSSSYLGIMGGSAASWVQSMINFYNARVGSSSYPGSVWTEAPSINDFAQIVYEEATTEGVRADVVFCQSMIETGYLRYGGQVNVNQRNFCGLKTSDGSGFATFESVRIGVRAHVQHLKAYASTSDLVNPCVDPRFNLVTRGIAPTLPGLDNRWAVPGDNYGENIAALCKEMKTY